jgi:predicted ester cyclase
MSKENLENNKEVALSLSKAIMNGQWEEVNTILSDDFVYTGDGRPAMNKQEYIGFMQGVLSKAFADMDMKFLRVIGEEDIVAIDYTNTMTQVGNWYGVPATNKRVVGSGQFMRQIKDGKVVAEWQTTNGAGLMMQLTAQK